MPSIIIPSRWRRQPPYPVEIASNNVYGRFCSGSFLPGGVSFYSARGGLAGVIPVTNTGSPVRSVGKAGQQVGCLTTSDYVALPNTSGLLGKSSRPHTIQFVGAVPDDHVSIFSLDIGASYALSLFATTYSGFGTLAFSDAGGFARVSFGPDGTPDTRIGIYTIGFDGTSYKNAVYVPIDSGSKTILAVAGNSAGHVANSNRFFDPNIAWAGGSLRVALFSFFDGACLVDTDLAVNPWQIFTPHRRVLYFETAGGGTIYNESLEETSTLIETYLSNVIYPISFTETAGLIDSNQASNITSTTITEVGGLQDSVAATQTLGALLNESATLTDSNTVLTTFNPTLTEQTVLQDSNDVLTTFNTTITDSLTGIDDYTGLVIFSATITETLTDPDSYIADVSVVINESIAGTDNYSVTVNYVTTLNETASAVDTISTSWVCSATLTEIQTLVDSISAYISGEEPTSFDIVSLKSFITRLLPTNSKITTSITKNSKL